MLPPLTTVGTRRAEMGAAATSMLLLLMQLELPPRKSIDVGFEVVVRGST